MVTIKDIAKRLSISISTVSKGLNGASDISEDMRQLVLDTALEMGYIMKKKKAVMKHRVCIMVENMDYENINQFGYEIIAGFRLSASEHNYEVSVVPVNMSMQTLQPYENFMLQNEYDGAFFLGLELKDAYLKQLSHTATPTLLFDNYVDNPRVGYIATDNEAAVRDLILHLYELGHRRIAMLNGTKGSCVVQQRHSGYIHTLKSLGLTPVSDLVRFGSFEPECAADFVEGFLKNKATAILCASDLIASGVINELRRLGLRVPEDISVTGFDDLPVAKYLAPPLTTIRQERFSLGKAAFGQLHDLINQVPVTTLLLRGSLVVRSSTATCTAHKDI